MLTIKIGLTALVIGILALSYLAGWSVYHDSRWGESEGGSEKENEQ
jgi:hypothetical protein